MFYSVDILRNSGPGDSISSNPAGYIGVLYQRAGTLNVQRLSLMKENQISQVKEFSAFLYMGRCMSLGSLKPFL